MKFRISNVLDYECICMFCVGENQHHGRDLWGICGGGPDRCSKNGQVEQSHQSQNFFFVIQRDERRGLGRDLRQVCPLTHFFLFVLFWYKKSMILSDKTLFSSHSSREFWLLVQFFHLFHKSLTLAHTSGTTENPRTSLCVASPSGSRTLCTIYEKPKAKKKFW